MARRRAPASRTSRIRRTVRTIQRTALVSRIPKIVTDKAQKRLKRGSDMASREDSLGSYTGVNSDDPYEKPVQDADDL